MHATPHDSRQAPQFDFLSIAARRLSVKPEPAFDRLGRI
jgi:hypothetical protein